MTAASVYYLADVEGVVIYVGVTTLHPIRRALQHAEQKSWGGEVVSVRFERFADLLTASEQEDSEIKRLQPRHNVNQRDKVPVDLPSIHEVPKKIADQAIELWHGGGKRSVVVSEISDLVGRTVNEAWAQRLVRKYVGTAQREKPKGWRGVRVD